MCSHHFLTHSSALRWCHSIYSVWRSFLLWFPVAFEILLSVCGFQYFLRGYVWRAHLAFESDDIALGNSSIFRGSGWKRLYSHLPLACWCFVPNSWSQGFRVQLFVRRLLHFSPLAIHHLQKWVRKIPLDPGTVTSLTFSRESPIGNILLQCTISRLCTASKERYIGPLSRSTYGWSKGNTENPPSSLTLNKLAHLES